MNAPDAEPAPPSPYLFEYCSCTGVTRAEVMTALAAGAGTVDDVQLRTGACSGCGSCRWDLEALLQHVRCSSAQAKGAAESNAERA